MKQIRTDQDCLDTLLELAGKIRNFKQLVRQDPLSTIFLYLETIEEDMDIVLTYLQEDEHR